MKKGKVVFIMPRGVEGCGVTVSRLRMQSYAASNGYDAVIIASARSWTRKSCHDRGRFLFYDSIMGMKRMRKQHLEKADLIVYSGLPDKKNEEEGKAFIDLFISDLSAKKVFILHDHMPHSWRRNYIGATEEELFENFDRIFCYSKDSFIHKFIPQRKKVKYLTQTFDIDSFPKRKPVEEMDNRIAYFGRYASFKNPPRIFEFMKHLKRMKFSTHGTMRDMETKVNLLTADKTLKGPPRENVVECINIKDFIPYEKNKKGLLYVYGKYKYNEGLEMLRGFKYGANWFDIKSYNHTTCFENSSLEIIASGALGLFDEDWGNKIVFNGSDSRKFTELPDFCVWSKRNDPASVKEAAYKIKHINRDPELYDEMRDNAEELVRQHCQPKYTILPILKELK